jgi:hypothetical protein
MAKGTITDKINNVVAHHRSMQLRDAIGNQSRLPGAAGGSECSIGGCHCHHCDAAVDKFVIISPFVHAVPAQNSERSRMSRDFRATASRGTPAHGYRA